MAELLNVHFQLQTRDISLVVLTHKPDALLEIGATLVRLIHLIQALQSSFCERFLFLGCHGLSWVAGILCGVFESFPSLPQKVLGKNLLTFVY